MRLQQEALTEAEVEELKALLAAAGSQSLDYARGVFAAVGTAPSVLDATQWLPLLLGSEMRDRQTLKRLMDLLMRDYNSCIDCLNLGVPVVPSPTDEAAIQQFCRGYVRICQADEAWRGDMQAFALITPFAVLGDYLPDEIAPELATDSDDWRKRQREELAESVARLHGYFASAREPRSKPAVRSTKPGRNAACPCGSGKKYKRCCGAD